MLPVISMIFRREFSPCRKIICRRGIAKVAARKVIRASFARPSMGGEATRILRASPYRPTIAVRLAPGCTCRMRVSTSAFRLYQSTFGIEMNQAVLEYNATALPSLSRIMARCPYGPICSFSLITVTPCFFASLMALSNRPSTFR